MRIVIGKSGRREHRCNAGMQEGQCEDIHYYVSYNLQLVYLILSLIVNVRESLNKYNYNINL